MAKKSDKTNNDSDKMPDPVRSNKVPVSRAYVDAMEKRLMSAINSMYLEIKEFRKEVDGRFGQMEARIDRMEANLTAKIDQVLVAVQAQEDRNLYVLDGYSSIRQIQTDHSERLKRLENKTFGSSED